MSSKKLATEKKSVQAMLKKAKAEPKKKSKQTSSSVLSSKQSAPRVPKANAEEIRQKTAAQMKDEDSAAAEPPFQYETHVKRQILYVRVQLHKIPHKFVDLEGTNDDQLIVDTSKFTRKLRLVFPFPDNMKVDAAKAEYEYESGVLRCTFPIRQLPSSESSRIQEIIQKQRNGRKLRFEHQLDQNTGMEQRVRTRTLDLSNVENPNQKRKLRQQHQKQLQEDAAAEEEAANVPQLSAREERELLLKIGGGNNNKKNSSSSSSGNGSKYVSDSEGAKKIASDVSRQANKSIKENIFKSKKLEAEQSQKKQKSMSSSQRKKEVLNRSFMDVLKQKQQAVRQQIEASKPVEKKNKNKDSGVNKSVKFA